MMKSLLSVIVVFVLCMPGASSVDAGSLEETLITKALTEEQLQGKTAAELDILRNYIYARHGYQFRRADLKQYFSEFAWYKPTISDAAIVEKKLNPIEKQNVALLKKVETDLSGSAGKTSAGPAAATPTCGEFIDNESNIRSEPSVKSKLLGVSKTGEAFDVLDAKDPWYYIKTAGGITGWTHKKNIKLSLCKSGSTEQPATVEGGIDTRRPTPDENDGSDPGQRERTSVEIDLDLDKTPEKVELEPYESTAGEEVEETYYRLKVSRRKGSEWETIWTDEKNENPFYIGHGGVEYLQVVQDIDHDGKVEILSACAQSDVSPTLFRLFRWNGSKFELVKKALLTADTDNPTEMVWTESKGDNQQVKCWVLYFSETESGSGLNAFITSTLNDKYKSGQALVRHSNKGFSVEKWIEPMKVQ